MTEPTPAFREKFRTCIEEIQQLSNKEKWSEADTISKVILEIISCLGYKRDDYLQESGVHKGRADFALLEGTSHMWFIEVKQWSSPLQDNDIIQALNYANGKGLKYAALTNGQEWRVYDNSIQKGASEKQIFKINIFDPNAIDPLWLLSKECMISGALDLHKNKQILKNILGEELAKPNSKMIKQIVKILKSEFDLTTDGQSVIKAIGDLRQIADTGQCESTSAISQVLQNGSSVNNNANESKVGDARTNTIDELTKMDVTFSKPIKLRMGETEIPVTKWIEVLDSVIEFLFQEKRIRQLPYKLTSGSNSYFIEPSNGPKTIREPKRVKGSNGDWVYEAANDSKTKCRIVDVLWEQSGYRSQDLVITWQPKN